MSRSSAEAEYKTKANTICEVNWLVSLLKDFCFTNVTPVALFCVTISQLCILLQILFFMSARSILRLIVILFNKSFNKVWLKLL